MLQFPLRKNHSILQESLILNDLRIWMHLPQKMRMKNNTEKNRIYPDHKIEPPGYKMNLQKIIRYCLGTSNVHIWSLKKCLYSHHRRFMHYLVMSWIQDKVSEILVKTEGWNPQSTSPQDDTPATTYCDRSRHTRGPPLSPWRV